MTKHKSDNDWKKLLSEIEAEAKKKGLTQTAISERTDLKQQTVSRLFRMKYTPSIELVSVIAKAVGMELRVVRIDES